MAIGDRHQQGQLSVEENNLKPKQYEYIIHGELKI